MVAKGAGLVCVVQFPTTSRIAHALALGKANTTIERSAIRNAVMMEVSPGAR